jgi:cytoplasmic polyadenylation element-binding protein
LPPDIDEDEIVTHFRRYGNLIVDWPHKAESKSYFPPKGYAFLNKKKVYKISSRHV